MDGIWLIVGNTLRLKILLFVGSQKVFRIPQASPAENKSCVAKDTHFFELHSQLLVLQQRLFLVLLPWWNTTKKRPKHNDINRSLLVEEPNCANQIFEMSYCKFTMTEDWWRLSRSYSTFVYREYLHEKKHTNYGWWFRNPANQFIYVGYSVIYKVLAPSQVVIAGFLNHQLGHQLRMFSEQCPCACVIHLGSGYLQRLWRSPGRKIGSTVRIDQLGYTLR